MSGLLRPAVALCFALALASGCHAGKGPEMRVIGVHGESATPHEVVFVQVTNPAEKPMRLTKLEYTFAADGTTIAQGELPLEREIPAGAAVVVEVPMDGEATRPMTLQGTLTAELDQIVRIFRLNAQIQPH